MLTLKIIAGIVAIIVLATVVFITIKKIRNLYWNKFGFNIFSKKIVLLESLCITLTWIGYFIYDNAINEKGDIWNGLVLIILASFILLGIIIFIYKKTNLKYGTLAMMILLLKLLILGILVPLAIIYLIGVWIDKSTPENITEL